MQEGFGIIWFDMGKVVVKIPGKKGSPDTKQPTRFQHPIYLLQQAVGLIRQEMFDKVGTMNPIE
jgi:hypothetical protein